MRMRNGCLISKPPCVKIAQELVVVVVVVDDFI